MECKYCEKLCKRKTDLTRHENTCCLNPLNIKKCMYCGKVLLKKNNMFCNSSCSISYWNRKRDTRTPESRIKTSISMLKYYATRSLEDEKKFQRICTITAQKRKKPKRLCKVCEKIISFNNKYDYCKEHYLQSPEGLKNSGKTYKNYVRGWVYNKWVDKWEYLQSTLEFRYYTYLSNNNIRWEKPTKIVYNIDGKNHNYFADFFIPESEEYIELKAYFFPTDKQKMETVVDQHPELKIRIIWDNEVEYYDYEYLVAAGLIRWEKVSEIKPSAEEVEKRRREKLSVIAKGRVLTVETRKKISETLKTNAKEIKMYGKL